MWKIGDAVISPTLEEVFSPGTAWLLKVQWKQFTCIFPQTHHLPFSLSYSISGLEQQQKHGLSIGFSTTKKGPRCQCHRENEILHIAFQSSPQVKRERTNLPKLTRTKLLLPSHCTTLKLRMNRWDFPVLSCFDLKAGLFFVPGQVWFPNWLVNYLISNVINMAINKMNNALWS